MTFEIFSHTDIVFYTEMETTWKAEPVKVMDNEKNV